MSKYKDAFGVPIEEGDYIASAAWSTGRVKLGHALPRERSLMMTVERVNWSGFGEPRKVGAAGASVLVLRKADGTVPPHILGAGNDAE